MTNPGREKPREMITLNEYLEYRNIEIDKSTRQRMANILAEKYFKKYGEKPRIVYRQSKGGRWDTKVMGYSWSDMQMLDDALKEAEEKAIKPPDDL